METNEDILNVYEKSPPHAVCRMIHISTSIFPYDISRYKFPILGKNYQEVKWAYDVRGDQIYWIYSRCVGDGISSICLEVNNDRIRSVNFDWTPTIITKEDEYRLSLVYNGNEWVKD